MLPQHSGHHAGHAQLQRVRPTSVLKWKAVSQHVLLNVLLPDKTQQRTNSATVTDSGTAVIQLQLELLCVTTARAVVMIYLVTG